MVPVFLTVDTEIWSDPSAIFTARENSPVPSLEGAVSTYLEGKTPSGNYGLTYQLELRCYGLRPPISWSLSSVACLQSRGRAPAPRANLRAHPRTWPGGATARG